MNLTYIGSKVYEDLKASSPVFEKALNYLEKLIVELPENGRYEVDGDKIYINVSSYETKPVSNERLFESHKDYIDIQVMVKGREMIGFAPEEALTVTTPYNKEGDYELYAMADDIDRVIFTEGKLAVIYPGEPHAPGLACGSPENVKKAVIKVLVKELEK